MARLHGVTFSTRRELPCDLCHYRTVYDHQPIRTAHTPSHIQHQRNDLQRSTRDHSLIFRRLRRRKNGQQETTIALRKARCILTRFLHFLVKGALGRIMRRLLRANAPYPRPLSIRFRRLISVTSTRSLPLPMCRNPKYQKA